MNLPLQKLQHQTRRQFLRNAGQFSLGAIAMESLLKEICPPKRWADFLERKDLDLAHEIPGLARFRGNYLYNHWGQAAVFRQIPAKILSFDELKLPEALKKLCHLNEGLVVVTGPTGSGKTTTLYATLKKLATEDVNVCTIEDPIEMIEPSFNQTQVNTAIDMGFAEGLRALMRQDPDIIMVGEIRDLATAEMAIQADRKSVV